MSDSNSVLYTAVYADTETALADLAAFEDLHDQGFIGRYDAAVIANEDGTPHVIKRTDHPGIRVIPEAFGGGPLRRHDLHDAATKLDAGQAGLIVVGEPTIEKGFDRAITRASKVIKQQIDKTTDDLAAALESTTKS